MDRARSVEGYSEENLISGYIAALTILLMLGMMLTRVLMMKRRGIEAFHFGKLDRKDFLSFPNWILLVYLAAGTWLFHRQVLREEEYLKQHYGKEYLDYSNRVRRYL